MILSLALCHSCLSGLAEANSFSSGCSQARVEEGENVNTTLQAYFFGKNGENKLQYQEFLRYVNVVGGPELPW